MRFSPPVIRSIAICSIAIAATCVQTAAQTDLPPNDECTNATPIQGWGIFQFDNTRPREETDYGCPMVNDLWYCWTSPYAAPITIDTCGTTLVDTRIAVHQGCECPPSILTQLECEWAELDGPYLDWPYCGYQSRVSFTAQQGESYLIRLGTYPSSDASLVGGTGAFTIQYGGLVEPACGLPNEDCQPPDTFDGILSTRTRATAAAQFTPVEDGAVTDLCFWGLYLDQQGNASPEAWGDFEVRYLRDAGGVPGNPIVGPFSQEDGSLAIVGPARTDRVTAGIAHEYEYTAHHIPVYVKAGVCYWIEIINGPRDDANWLWSTTSDDRGRAVRDGNDYAPPDGYDRGDAIPERLAFRMNIPLAATAACTTPPSNDECGIGLPVTDGVAYFDTLGAATDGPPEQPECDPPTEWCCNFPLGDDYVNRDLWFDYVATCTGIATFDVDGSFFDTKMAVYDGAACPPSGFAIACNDDIAGTGGPASSRAATPVVMGSSYKIRVGGFREAAGWGTLSVDCGPPPANDLCADAAVETLPATLTGTNLHVTSDCSRIPGTHAWIAFELPEAGAVTIDYAGSPTAFADASSFLATDCTCDALIAADREFANDGSPLRAWDCLAAGTYYYPVVATPGSEGEYSISVTTSPCIDPCEAAEGDCYAEHDTPGCQDADCCRTVCELDGHCCTNEWDAICTQIATAACGSFPRDVCSGATGDCYVPHNSPGCEDGPICRSICRCDPFCCIYDWDIFCAGDGYLPEPGCGGAADCNNNGYIDQEEIEWPEHSGQADCNGNLLPDGCDAISPGDFDGDFLIDLTDYSFFPDCFRGPQFRPLPPMVLCADACLMAFNLVDQPQQTVDLADFAVLQNMMGRETP